LAGPFPAWNIAPDRQSYYQTPVSTLLQTKQAAEAEAAGAASAAAATKAALEAKQAEVEEQR
jgi:hypothetical protein